MSATLCHCSNPKPRTSGVGKVVCQECKREVKAEKKSETDAEEHDTIPADAQALLREIHETRREFNRRLDRLNKKLESLKIRHAS